MSESSAVERACELLGGMLPAGSDVTVDVLRQSYRDWCARFPLDPDVTVEPASLGGVPGLWVSVPESEPDRVILHLHGGAYAIGSAEGHRELTSRLARAARARMAVLDYPLAPEHPFPAAVHATLAAYGALLATGVPARRIAIVGESAGGGLTMATLLAIRDAGIPLPGSAVALSPWVDLECGGDSMLTNAAVDPLVSKENLLASARDYLAGADPRNPFASPLYGDLSGLPPLLIQVGTRETLLDDAVRLADRARGAGVPVTLTVVEDVPHIWHHFGSFLPQARRSTAEVGSFVVSHASLTG